MKITTPTLLIDESIVKRNISSMMAKALKNKVKLQPHFKTHQSTDVAKWFREAGVTDITVSSLGMADYFAQSGWTNITVAIPCNILQMELINKLASFVNLTLLVDQVETVRRLNEELAHKVNILIEIDTEMHRTGVQWDNLDAIKMIAKAIVDGEKTTLKGIYCHAGNSYAARGREEITKVYENTIERISKVKASLLIGYGKLEVCYGDTPTCSVVQDFSEITIMSPGNFAFYDLMQHQIGSCAAGQIGVVMACPVLSIDKHRNEACIYGGAVHFSKDFIIENTEKVFGKMVDYSAGKWESPIEGCYIKSLSQEHGKVKLSSDVIKTLRVGDLLYFLPIHSCLTAESSGYYLTTSGQVIDHYNKSNRA